MKFSRYNNPNKRRPVARKPRHSDGYMAAREAELAKALQGVEDPAKRQMIIDAYRITINP